MPEPGVGRKSDSITSTKKVTPKRTAPAPEPEKKGFFDTIKAIPGGIVRDVGMGISANPFAGRDKQRENLQTKGYTPAQINDYFARTDATKARMDAEAAARGDRDDRRSDTVTGAPVIDAPPEEQMPVYRSPFGTAPPVGTTIGRPGPEITPQMRAAALQMFESQRGAGQIPYQMLPYQQGLGSIRRPDVRIPVPDVGIPVPDVRTPVPWLPGPVAPMRDFQPMPPMRQNPNVSPAFQYAAQNYQRLGGSQRLMDRPMEMMSAAERQRINEMSRAMAERQEYDMGRRMMGKGGGAVEPRRPLPSGFGDDVAPGMAGRSFGIASLQGLPSYLVR